MPFYDFLSCSILKGLGYFRFGAVNAQKANSCIRVWVNSCDTGRLVLWLEELQSHNVTLFIHRLETNFINPADFLQDNPSENQKHFFTLVTHFNDGFMFFDYKFFKLIANQLIIITQDLA